MRLNNATPFHWCQEAQSDIWIPIIKKIRRFQDRLTKVAWK